MSYDWSQFLKLAEQLQAEPNTPGPPEANRRSAVSRAYYAVYHSALDLARSDPGSKGKFKGYADHYELSQYFKNSKDGTRSQIGSLLESLRKRRNIADYDDEIRSPIKKFAEAGVVEANKIEQLLQRLK